jgi:hypothetical protein
MLYVGYLKKIFAVVGFWILVFCGWGDFFSYAIVKTGTEVKNDQVAEKIEVVHIHKL